MLVTLLYRAATSGLCDLLQTCLQIEDAYALMKSMPKKQTKNRSKTHVAAASQTFDGVFLFKLVFYLILGSIWLKASNGNDINVPIPLGLIIGLLFTAHEHFQIDRKIEYAVLVVAMLFGFFAPYGLYINF